LNYGSFLLALVPMSIVMIPLIPFALIRKPPVNVNKFLTLLQYLVFIATVYFIFLTGSVLMMPLAFTKNLGTKLQPVIIA